ncbi:MAG: amidase [Actinomycetota bacterium]
MTPSLPAFSVVDASIDELAAALAAGAVTSVGLVARYLNRIAFYDRRGIRLNAVPVLNPRVFADAAESDARRAGGQTLGLLDGIPYTAKDSYMVRGLTVAAGSPAFEHLIATDDAFTIGRLRAAGAVLIGLTNMPPMANGGMQRGLYGRAESPYNADFLTAAFGSGSSNGSGTATAASFAAFGLGEETWSSGRAPASNNALVAYTPSRGVISVRGNWPLVPTMDVVVPHTRSVDDLLRVLDAIVADDPETRGDFWRVQPWVPIPPASEVRPASYHTLRKDASLRGQRLGVPRMYINADHDAPSPITTRASVIALWEGARRALESLGAEVVEVDFPVVSNYERDRPGALSMVDRGIVPAEFADRELWELSMLAWHDFLASNDDPALHALADVDGARIFPHPSGALPDRYGDFDLADYVTRARELGIVALADIPSIREGLLGLEATRRVDFEDWLVELGLDAVVFPAVADVGRSDSDVSPQSAAEAWRNGTAVANGNLVPRHLGIPSVTVPMGLMADTRMPVGLSFLGAAYDDSRLLQFASAFEAATRLRVSPPRTPRLDESADSKPRLSMSPSVIELRMEPVRVDAETDGSRMATVTVRATSPRGGLAVRVFANGTEADVSGTGDEFSAIIRLPASETNEPHSEWVPPYGPLVVVLARDVTGAEAGHLVELA